MKNFRKNKLAMVIVATLSAYSGMGTAEIYEWNNSAGNNDYHDEDNWATLPDDYNSTIILGNTDQTLHVSMDDGAWLTPAWLHGQQFIFGYNGGKASIIFDRDPTNNNGSNYSGSEFLIGSGTNSVGEVTLLSGGKTIAEQSYNGHSLMQYADITVGHNGGTGKFNIDGTGINIDQQYSLFIGSGTDSVGHVSVLGGGKLFAGSFNYHDYYDWDEEAFSENNVGSSKTLVGYEGGTGTLTVNGQNAAGDATSRAYLWKGTVIGSGDQSIGHVYVENGGILNAAGYSGVDEQRIEDLNLNEQAFVVGHNGGTGYATVDNGTLNVSTNMGQMYSDDYISNESQVGNIHIGYSGYGALAIKNQGTVNATSIYLYSGNDAQGNYVNDHKIGTEQGLLTLGQYASGTGELFIGSFLGDAVSAAGYLNVSKIIVGEGQGSVNFNHSDTDYVFDTPIESTIQGVGDVNAYSGVTILNPVDENDIEVDFSYSGSTTVHGGELRAGRENVFSVDSAHYTKQGGVLSLDNYDQTISSLNNGGLVSLSVGGASVTRSTSQLGTLLTISGNYIGEGGTILFDTALGDDNSATDKVIIEGQASGKTYVAINNVGGLGAETINGIEIITTQGSTEDAFEKAGRIVAGAYDYTVEKKDNNWYLVNEVIVDINDPNNPNDDDVIDIIRPESGAYIANLAAANTMFASRLHNRLGETQYTDYLTGETKATSMWLRQEGGHNRSKTKSGQSKTQANRYVVQIGGDIAQWSSDNLDRFHLGVMAGYGYYQGNTQSEYTGYYAKNRVDGYSVGLYGTWYANKEDKSGLYVDSWVQYAWFDNSVRGEGLAEESYKSKGWLASIEAGYSFKLGENDRMSYWIQPKAQVTWMGVHADKHTEANGTKVWGRGDNVSTRLGVRAYLQGHSAIDDNTGRKFQPFVEANWLYNSKSFGATMNGVTDSQAGTRNVGELKVGVEAHLNKNVNMWGSIAQQVGGKGYSDTQATIGIKFSF